MPQSRRSQISLADTPYYHCVSRCVRQCYLCGVDQNSGKSFEHRRGWVERRLLELASVYSINICAYAVMSNHVHVVLHVDKQGANSWNLEQVLTQWHRIHKGTLLTQRYLKGERLSEAELQTVTDTAEVYRQRLYDISWFMRNLNEFIARAANKEDECTGRFWEGRLPTEFSRENREEKRGCCKKGKENRRGARGKPALAQPRASRARTSTSHRPAHSAIGGIFFSITRL